MRVHPLALKRIVAALVCVPLLATGVAAADKEPLRLLEKIALGPSRGRIDHLSLDRDHHRLFVAELGNDSVAAVDLAPGHAVQRITGLKEPQGVLYAGRFDVLVVANAGDGSVRLFKGSDLSALQSIDLKEDADNLRLDTKNGLAWVGYGEGGLAAIDPLTFAKKASVPLKGHPEGFQIAGDRIYVNVPGAHQIAVIDSTAAKQIDAWKLDAGGNYPMALADGGKTIAAGFRNPAVLTLFGTDGKQLAQAPICGDTDDVFADDKRHRFYVSCGSGAIDVMSWENGKLAQLTRVKTESGARTALFDSEGDRFYLAVRVSSSHPAEIWVFQPQ